MDPHALLARQDDLPQNVNWEGDILGAWAQLDASAAIAWAAKHGNEESISRAFAQISDPETIFAQLATLSPEQQLKVAEGRLGIDWRAPESFLEALQSEDTIDANARATLEKRITDSLTRYAQPPVPDQPPPATPTEIANGMAVGQRPSFRDIDQLGEQALLAAIDDLASAVAQQARLTFMKSAREEQKHQMAAEIVLLLPLELPDVIEEISRLSVHWTHQDPAAATQWIESLPEGSSRNWAAKNAAAQWARQNPEAAEAWLSKFPEAQQMEWPW